MKTITRGPRRLGQLIFIAVLFGLVADATAQQPVELIIRNGLIVTADGRSPDAVTMWLDAKLLAP